MLAVGCSLFPLRSTAGTSSAHSPSSARWRGWQSWDIGQLPHRQIVLGHQRPQYQPLGLLRGLLSHAPVYATSPARLSNLV
jgi:hypothetical protein